MTRLFIAEKPNVGTSIAAQLGVKERKDGYLVTKSGDLVTWCFGHLMELAEPDAYLGKDVPEAKNGSKVWREQDLPIFPQQWKNTVKKDCKKQFRLIGTLLKKCTQVVHCGDIDREGQLLVDEVLEYYKNTKPIVRCSLSSLDAESIQKALRTLEPNTKFKGKLLAAKGRQRADWLIGMNLTRAYTLAAQRSGSGALLSVGRVQTPTLNLVAQRDAAIKNFKPQPYFVFKGDFNAHGITFSATLKYRDDQTGLDKEGRLINMTAAKALAAQLQSGKSAFVSSFSVKEKLLEQPKAYSLADLQLEANNKYGLSAQKTLDICQSLYETHKLTSYPRVDCQYLPESQHKDAARILNTLKAVNPDLAGLVSKADPKIKSKTWNDGKITAHHGIIPTLHQGDRSKLSPNELNVYLLIVKRYLAQFFPPCRMSSTQLSLELNGQTFTASGSVMLDPGFKVVTGLKEDSDDKDKSKDPEQKLPLLKQGEEVKVLKMNCLQEKTKAPPAFTEGTLIKAMENIHTVVDDPTYKKYLKDGDGIGTNATRAAIIAELKRKGFLVVTGKKVHAAPLGLQLLSELPELTKNPVLTAMFESKLKDVEAGKMTLDAFEQEQRTFVSKCVAAAAQKSIQIKK